MKSTSYTDATLKNASGAKMPTKKYVMTFMAQATMDVEATDIIKAGAAARKFIDSEKAKHKYPPILLRLDEKQELEPQTS